MLKKNKISLILSSVTILLPAIIGIIFWDKLPDEIVTHWDGNNVPNGTSAKAFAVFGLPLILLALQWIAVFFTEKDPGNKNQNKKALGMVLWIVPAVSLMVNSVMYSVALGKEVSPEMIHPYLIGGMFLVFGNYLPKISHNYTLGIKLPWTIADEENWQKTHRLGGKLWVAGGIIILISSFFSEKVIIPTLCVVLFIIAVIPTVYSYRIYKATYGTAKTPKAEMPFDKGVKIFGIAMIVILVLVLGVTIFTGEIETNLTENALQIDASFWYDFTLNYNEIDSAEYLETVPDSRRTNGYGSPRLLLGTFENEDFGIYTRYTYNAESPAVLIKSGENILVVGLKTPEETKALYESLSEKME